MSIIQLLIRVGTLKRLTYMGLSLFLALHLSLVPSRVHASASATDTQAPEAMDEYTDPTKVPLEFNMDLLDHLIIKLPKVQKPELGKETLSPLEASWCYAHIILYHDIIRSPLTDNARDKVREARKVFSERCSMDKMKPHEKFATDLFNPHLDYMIWVSRLWLLGQYRMDGALLNTSAFSPKQIKKIQTYLAQKGDGFFKGIPDGKFGKETQKAIVDFQKAAKIEANGELTLGTLFLLGFTLEDFEDRD